MSSAFIVDARAQGPDAQAKTGLSWLHRWMLAKGLEMRPEPSEPEWIAELHESYLRK